jgi:hypothetical protein
MKTLAKFEVVYHGPEHSQYFQGCGVAFTDYDFVVTGAGDSWSDALADALDQLCQSHDEKRDTDAICNRITDDFLDDFERDKKDPEKCQIEEEEEDWYVYLSIRYSLEECDEIPRNWADDYCYFGDRDLLYGGLFLDLSEWKYGYVPAVEITDLGSACGAEGLFLIEHKTILVERWTRQGWNEETYCYWDNWESALKCCGPSPGDLLRMDSEGRKIALAYALNGYGRVDPDDAWDNYQSPAHTIVAVGHRGDAKEVDGWKIDERVFSEREFYELVLRDHLTTDFCSDRKGVSNV